ncbi:MAG: PQQ-dependent sugar dehydrogenase [Alphaproteobacteria bacterium]|nr:PQQ-dependent sugar dehydrogenase [Alphaproteobacteria bacterium]
MSARTSIGLPRILATLLAWLLVACAPAPDTDGKGDDSDTADVVDSPPPAVVCGDGDCTGTEDAAACPEDCPATCGDGACTHAEGPAACPQDCPATCGDGACTHAEDATSCPGDCLGTCGDGACTGTEDAASCPADCLGTCGDGACTHAESAADCPDDCAADCGDGACTHAETAVGCADDCAPTCGDDACTHAEDAEACPDDCPAGCGDGFCTHAEDAAACPEDCPKDCGDGACTHDEVYTTCADDCATTCGDGACADDEDASSCPRDCPAVCPDAACTHDEDAASCPDDCAAVCPDGACTHGETHETCPQDCPDCPGGEGCPRGLDARPVPSGCHLDGEPDTWAYEVDPTPFATGFSFPVDVLSPPGQPDTLYVVEGPGRVISVSRRDPAVRTTVLDVAAQTAPALGGLFAVAPAPDFATTGHLYTSRTIGSPSRILVSRFLVEPPVGGTANVNKGTPVLVVRLDGAANAGGPLLFGPDGMLYLAVGAGATGGNTAQDPRSALGKVLRVDPGRLEAGLAYGVPADNPLVGTGSTCGACLTEPDFLCDTPCTEVWASGLRNPRRCSFDPDGRLWCGDVGFASWHEVDLITAGSNHGWNCLEGSTEITTHAPEVDCDRTFDEAVHAYPQTPGATGITGGLVYRGEAFPDLKGRYLFLDAGLGTLTALEHEEGVLVSTRVIADVPSTIVAIAEDADGELLLVDRPGGTLLRLRPTERLATGTFPDTLGATGCYADLPAGTPADDLIPLDPRVASWADDATRRTYLRLPGPTATVRAPAGLGALRRAADEALDLPVGTILLQELRRPRPTAGDAPALVESRFLVRRSAGDWDAYTYLWRADGSDADLVTFATTACLDATPPGTPEACQRPHEVPAAPTCLGCHTAVAGRTLGLRPAQLNRLQAYPGGDDNQLRVLDHLGVFDPPLGALPVDLPAWADPLGDAGLDERARVYLAAN